MPEQQSFENHTQKVRLFGTSLILLMLAFVAGIITVIHAWDENKIQLHDALVMVVVIFAVFLGFTQCRRMALKVQDRAIRAEENLRHYVLTGKLLDKRLTLRQIVAVRFASDDEFPNLAREAAETGMKPKAIKQAVKTWRPDFDRA
jgi:hypothetical protein